MRPSHLIAEVILVLTGFGLAASLIRAPHVLTADLLALRTGFLGGLDLPRHVIGSASFVVRSVPGRGLRPVPDEPDAVACSVGEEVNLRLVLDPPQSLDLGRSRGTVLAAVVYAEANSPRPLLAALAARAGS
ncbi:hypothetical protein ACN20G_32005 (plasmid) [Streptomyces sp. BI20]|uniref:hypothetical protein n=1 Tax=Streptomyces sp. BI20 TaxID=3403460 RepID=UPI003C71D245